MSRMAYVDEELPLLNVPGKPRRFLLRTPEPLTEDPALLINLSMDRRHSLDDLPYCIASDIFVAAGHRAASFDLPNHGDNIDAHGSGLDGIAAAMAKGIDAFELVRSAARSIAEQAVNNRWTRPGRIFACGTSRGGLSALHAMAAEPRIGGVATFAPVTNLPTLKEFAALADSPIVKKSNAESLVPLLAGRSVYVAIGLSDERVGTDRCLDFCARLRLADSHDRLLLHIDHGSGHRVSTAAHYRGAAFLLDLAAATTIPVAPADDGRGPSRDRA